MFAIKFRDCLFLLLLQSMPSKKAGFCAICTKMVQQYPRHYARCHQEKYWGYRCPKCPVIQSKMDASFMRRHLASHQGTFDLLSCRVIVPEGYSSLKVCPICSVRTFTDAEMADHFFLAHPPPAAAQPLEELLDEIDQADVTSVAYPDFEMISPPSSPKPLSPTVTAEPCIVVTHEVSDGKLLPLPQVVTLSESVVKYGMV